MLAKKKIIGTVCALTLLGATSFSIAYADEMGEAVKEFKGKIHKSFIAADFSEYESLTDAKISELNTLQTKLKALKEEEKNIEEEMKTILKDSGITLNERLKLTDEEKEGREFKEKFEKAELTDEEKAEIKEKLQERKGFNKGKNKRDLNKESKTNEV